jgi:predicted ATPase
LRGQNLFYAVRADYNTAMDLGRQLLEAAAESQSPEHLLEGHLTLGLNLLYLGRFKESRAHFEQGLALQDSADRPLQAFQYVGHSGAICRSYLGRTLSFLGYHDSALKFSREGLALARTLSIPMSQAQALGMLANHYQIRRETEAAQHWSAETLTYATAHGFPYWTSLSSMVGGWVMAHHGQLGAGIDQLRGGLDRYLATGARLGLSWFLVMLAELYAMNRQWDEGFDALDRALSHVAQTGERYYEAEVHRLKGDFIWLQGGSSASPAAETFLRQALGIAREQSAKSWELRAATSLAKLWRDEHRPEEARDLLAGVLDWFSEGFDTPDLQNATRVLDELTYRSKRQA